MNLIKVKCTNIRKTMPGHILVGNIYYIDSMSFFDDGEDWYCKVYADVQRTSCIGTLKLSHFTRIE